MLILGILPVLLTNPGDCSNRSIRKLKWLQSYLSSAEEKLENFQEKLIENEATLTYARHANDRKVDRLYSHQEVRGAFKNGWVIDYTSYRDEEEVIIIMAYGDHYLVGNDLGIGPGYFHDQYLERNSEGSVHIQPDHLKKSVARITQYLHELEQTDYPYDFVPVMVSGRFGDNCPPNATIMEYMQAWNEQYGAQVKIEMSTLSAFFAHVKEQTIEIPTYKGDWPDWWADGVASTLQHTQLFRRAQRTLKLIKRMDGQAQVVSKAQLEAAEQKLMLYAEHTWGHYASVTDPTAFDVHALGFRKEALASAADEIVMNAWDDMTEHHGEAILSSSGGMRYKLINPYQTAQDTCVRLKTIAWDQENIIAGIEVVNEATDTILPHQLEPELGYRIIVVHVCLEPNETLILNVRPQAQKLKELSKPFVGDDGVSDMLGTMLPATSILYAKMSCERFVTYNAFRTYLVEE